MNREEPTPVARPIPYNLNSGLNILGKTYGPLSIIEALIIGIVVFVLVYFPLHTFCSSNFGMVLGISLGLSVLCGYRALNGIEDESITGYLYGIYRFRKNRRISFYNPSFKAKNSSDSASETAQTPREVVVSLMQRLLALFPEREEKQEDKSHFDENRMVFRD